MLIDNMRSSAHLVSIFILVFFLCFSIGNGEEKKNFIEIAVIGDSLVRGYGLVEKDGFVAKLQAGLAKAGLPVELRNFGVSGDTTSGGLEKFNWIITPSTRGVVIFLGANDMLRGLPIKNIYSNLRKLILLAKKNKLPILLVGIKGITNFGPEYKMKFDEIFVRLNEEFSIFYYPDFFATLRSEGPEKFSLYMQTDRIHPNAIGVDLIVTEFLPLMKQFVASIGKN